MMLDRPEPEYLAMLTDRTRKYIADLEQNCDESNRQYCDLIKCHGISFLYSHEDIVRYIQEDMAKGAKAFANAIAALNRIMLAVGVRNGGVTDLCDTADGHCACGAKHNPQDMADRIIKRIEGLVTARRTMPTRGTRSILWR